MRRRPLVPRTWIVVALATVGSWWAAGDVAPEGAVAITVEASTDTEAAEAGAIDGVVSDAITDPAPGPVPDGPVGSSTEPASTATVDVGTEPSTDTGSGPGTRPEAEPERAPCAEPPRILGIGDSIAAEAVGPAVDRLAELGYATALDARWGTGPLDTDPDWLALARGHAREFRPDLVLVLFYGNYSQPRFDDRGREILADTDEQYRLWAERARQITETFTDLGARVVWISPPPRPGSPRQVGVVSGTWPATAAAVDPLPGVSVRLSGSLIADTEGLWTPTIVGADGREHTVRSLDGVHLVPFSGDLMATDIVDVASAVLDRDVTCRRASIG